MVAACCVPVPIPGLLGLEWNRPLPGSVDLGAILLTLPGAALVAWLGPRVSYRRRDALTVIFFPPAGLRIAWIIGTRLAQLPYRTWEEQESIIPVHGRHYAWIALAGNRYNHWRRRRTKRAATETGLVPAAQSVLAQHSSSTPAPAETP
jgi:hypothetical protein